MISKADNLREVQKVENSLSKEDLENKHRAETEELVKQHAEKELREQKEQLEKEINSINNGIDFSTYKSSVEVMQIELSLFALWANITKEGEYSENVEIKKLVSQLKSKVQSLQVKEFPLLRKAYVDIAAKAMWLNDIAVTMDGAKNEYINFTGGTFAANKNKQDFQNELTEVLRMFRFSQSRYRWYKGEDTYTYYTMYEGKYSDLISFNNYVKWQYAQYVR
ncbi:MAG: hypothetical protein ACK5LR_11575 [Mangrovibacterium sp.]